MDNKTTYTKSYNTDKKWHVVDAKGRILGKLASEIAVILSGKNKAEYTPMTNTGDYVIVKNAKNIEVTGKKLEAKSYKWYTGYPGGLRSIALKDLMEKKPTEALRLAVKGMLPKNKLLRERLKNLHIYAGEEHPHKAQETK